MFLLGFAGFGATGPSSSIISQISLTLFSFINSWYIKYISLLILLTLLMVVETKMTQLRHFGRFKKGNFTIDVYDYYHTIQSQLLHLALTDIQAPRHVKPLRTSLLKYLLIP